MATFDPYVDLKQHLASRQVCAFVGAGLSVGAGLPSWYDLISQLSQRIGYERPQMVELPGDGDRTTALAGWLDSLSSSGQTDVLRCSVTGVVPC